MNEETGISGAPFTGQHDRHSMAHDNGEQQAQRTRGTPAADLGSRLLVSRLLISSSARSNSPPVSGCAARCAAIVRACAH